MQSINWEEVLCVQEQIRLAQQKKDSLQVLSKWQEMEESIKTNPILYKTLKDWKKQFQDDPNKISLHPKLAQAVLALNLEDE